MNRQDAGDLVRGLLLAIEARSWDDFAGCMDDSTIVVADHQEGSQRFVPWPDIRDAWQRAFLSKAPRFPRPVRHTDAMVEMVGSSAFVSFGLDGRAPRKQRALVLCRSGDRWVVRHLYVGRLPSGTPRPVLEQAQAPASEPAHDPVQGFNGQPLYAALLAVALIAIARLGVLHAEAVNIQTTAAIAAVFLGAVATLNRDLGSWFHGGETGAAADAPLACSGALVVMVGAAFLVT